MDRIQTANALIRDERNLGSALAEHEKRRFDVDSARAVRHRVEDLLETVEAVAHDDDFWDRLTDAARPPTDEQLKRVSQIDTLAFAALLEASGYTSPPPPPADVLVDDTIAALVAAAEITDPGTAHTRVKNARWYLLTLVMRVRRQIIEEQSPQTAPSRLRSAAHSLGRTARWLIPIAAIGAASAAAAGALPTGGTSLILAGAIGVVADQLADRVSDIVIGSPQSAEVNTEDQHFYEYEWTPASVLAAHIAALSDGLGALFGQSNSLDGTRTVVADSRRHLDRLEELFNDNQYDREFTGSRILIVRGILDGTPHAGGSADGKYLPEGFTAAMQAADELRNNLNYH